MNWPVSELNSTQSQLVLDERQTTIRALEEELNSEIHRLEAQLAEKQTLLDRGHLELQEKGSEISALREEITQSEFARRQTEMLAATQAEQIRERVKAVVGELDSQLREKENALKVAADRPASWNRSSMQRSLICRCNSLKSSRSCKAEISN